MYTDEITDIITRMVYNFNNEVEYLIKKIPSSDTVPSETVEIPRLRCGWQHPIWFQSLRSFVVPNECTCPINDCACLRMENF